MTLENIRQDIDRIDARIVALLTERMEKGLLSRRFKSTTLDAGREQVVLQGVAARSAGLASPGFTEGLYKLILAESKAVQERSMPTVGFQGVHGAYGDSASRAWLPQGATIPCHDFSKVFEGVQAGFLDFGVVPVENTLGGTVGQVNSILASTDLHIVGAVDMPIEHCLLALPGQDHREIRYVYSHPQALSQCRRFLERNKLDGREFFDTAGAAKMLAEERPNGTAAIAGRFAAELYGLEIIKEGIQDASSNRTRFFALSKGGVALSKGGGTLSKDGGALAKDDGSTTRTEAALRGTDTQKCSAVFFANDKAGALFKVLEVFAKSNINLTRIESVPYNPGDYAIFLDFDGSDQDDKVQAAMESATAIARDFRKLGCYIERKL
jgi:prephenate dehydratase/chorismate mutase/prephenate dehydratase